MGVRNNLGAEADESDGVGGEPGVGPAVVGVVVGIVDFHLKVSQKNNLRVKLYYISRYLEVRGY